MQTRSITSEALSRSVIAVPPLARTSELSIDHAENVRLIRHLERGGIRTLLYGGNAVLGHVSPSEYADFLQHLSESAGAETLAIPSVGPSFGMMRDQAKILREFAFPTAMLLPTNDPTTPLGLARSIRHFADLSDKPCLLYLKREGFMDVGTVRRLFQDGLISCVKYAIVREDPGRDTYLSELIDGIGPELIVSGMGEQPAIVHMRQYGLRGFTSGCVCISPSLSMRMLHALQSGDTELAERIREQFKPLETLRDTISPVRVLHTAVQVAGICETGPISPPLAEISEDEASSVSTEVKKLLSAS